MVPMILTPPGSELVLPQEFGYPPGSTWRMAECLGSCFFVALASAATFRSPDVRTMIICWDSDLVAFVQSPHMAMKVHALRHVKTNHVDCQPVSLTVRDVREIWLGRDLAANGAEVIVFKATDGSSFCGVDGVPVPASVQIDALAAAVGATHIND